MLNSVMQRYTYKVGQYLDDLVSEEPQKRVEACEHLPEIWKALGKQKTLAQFLPFLQSSSRLQGISEGTEEFLVKLASHVRNLVLFIGTDNLHQVTNLIFSLFTSEDHSVRETVIFSDRDASGT